MIPVFGIALLVSKYQCIVHFFFPFPIILHVYKASLVVWPREARKGTHIHTRYVAPFFSPFCLPWPSGSPLLPATSSLPCSCLMLSYVSPQELPLLVLPPLEEQHPVSLLRVCTIRSSQFAIRGRRTF